MSKEDILQYFYTNNANLNSKTILIIMLAALLVASIIYITYYISYKGVSYNNKFNLSLVMNLLISVVIMLMISSNIVISLGMVGALSIIRFRTAIKDSRDTTFIFWAISEGLCVGSQNFKLAIITTLFIAIILMIANNIPKIYNKYLLIIHGEKESIDTVEFVNKMSEYVIYYKLRNANKDNDNQEMIYEIKTKGELNTNIIDYLLKIKGVKSVNWISESSDILG